MESDMHLLYFIKLSRKSQDFYFLVAIHLKSSFNELRLQWMNSAKILNQSIAPTKFHHYPRRIAPEGAVMD